jgi:hypothetical protein
MATQQSSDIKQQVQELRDLFADRRCAGDDENRAGECAPQHGIGGGGISEGTDNWDGKRRPGR